MPPPGKGLVASRYCQSGCSAEANKPSVCTTPLWLSSLPSPPSPELPVTLVDAATSAPVALASASIKDCPSAPAATLQPYSMMSPSSLRLAPILASTCAWRLKAALSTTELPRLSCPCEPWLMTCSAVSPVTPSRAAAICSRPSRSASRNTSRT